MAMRDYINGSRTGKAKGKIFSRWVHADYRVLDFKINLESTKSFEKDYGDAFALDEFIKECEYRNLINYDGSAGEILLNGMVVWNKGLVPSECLFYKKKLQELNKEHGGKLEIVWYNR